MLQHVAKIIYAIKGFSEHFSKSNIKNLSLLSQTHTCYARRTSQSHAPKRQKKFKNEKVSYRKS
jgi:hypothetical protein